MVSGRPLGFFFGINKMKAISRTVGGAVNRGRNTRTSPIHSEFLIPKRDLITEMQETIRLRPMMTPSNPLLDYRDVLYKSNKTRNFIVIVVSI
jgi:hypothetical protein